MKKNTYAIEHVVPHAHPMILIDELLEYDDSKALCQLTITENSNFYNSDTQSVPNYVAIEYMAQSIAAFANANEKDKGGEVSIGFLVSSRKLKVLVKEFSLASTLLVTVEQLYSEENGLSAFDCKIEQADQIVVEAKINIFQPNDAKAFLAEQ